MISKHYSFVTIPSSLSLSRAPLSPLHPHNSAACRTRLRAAPIVAMSTKSAQSRAELLATPGVAASRDPATNGFTFQQTMLRVRDPTESLKFYTGVMGMTLIARFDFADMKFSLYFLAMVDDPSEIPDDPVERAKWMFAKPACLELTHNWGTESDPEFKGYQNGNNDQSRGFGHIGFCVPSVAAACKRFEELGVKFVKRPEDGKMKNLAFIQDPDGYWIEILESNRAQVEGLVNWSGNNAA